MTTNKNRLKGMLNKGEPNPATPIQRGTPYQVSTAVTPAESDLPSQLGELSAPLQEIARRYVGARRRSGEALLEAARWLSEARSAADHGEWQLFLEATGTSADAAERLLNIHRTAMENPQFADAVARNWLGQSAAALLARPSTPPEAVADVLGSPELPSVEVVRGAITRARGARRSQGQNPQFADSSSVGAEGQNPQFADFASVEARQSEAPAALALEVLREATRAVESLQGVAPSLGSDEGRELIRRIKQAVYELERRVP